VTAKRKPGRPLQDAKAIVDDHLAKWGQEVGPDHYSFRKLGWADESILSRIQREGPGASQSGAPPLQISEISMIVDQAVANIQNPKTRRVVRLWYCSGSRMNQDMCARRVRLSISRFQFHLDVGRCQVAEMLGII
jgi:hypothetical protein